MDQEEWRWVEGCEGRYEVSNQGRVRSHCGPTTVVMKTTLTNVGYYQVCIVDLSRKRKHRNLTVHRLVANAFIPNPAGKPYVNHRDNDKHNNRVENLEWVTQAENLQHARAQGRMRLPPRFLGEKHWNAALDEQQVHRIRERYQYGLAQTLAVEYGVSRTTIMRVVHRRNWAHI
ncbi:MAG: HNH endonuclease [Alphaproteobacteria bacterium]|nr:HNH endonuclease [Alphaproteobacteria bacterium]MCW5741613.1 HNH endonuclease [Alphaproteobacteria bacterium]